MYGHTCSSRVAVCTDFDPASGTAPQLKQASQEGRRVPPARSGGAGRALLQIAAP
jgi:hypothetical protein